MKLQTGLLIVSCVLLFTGCSQTDHITKSKNVHTANKQELQHKQANDDLTLKVVYFNDIMKVNGKNVIQNPENILALVDKHFMLPDGYAPNDLVRPKVPFSFGDQSVEQALLRKEAAVALESMFSDAKKAGIQLYAVSGYRSFARQKSLFNAEVTQVGKKKAFEAVAVPGTSEHETGLAMDIGSRSTDFYLTQGFAQTKEGKWLAENADQYGFILRYPKGKETITAYEFEPWHYRYVGKKAARIIYKHHWSLEEYFQKVKKVSD